MALRRSATLAALVALGSCYTPPEPPPTVRTGPLQTTGLEIQAVDAGTGGVLEDADMTVRYLVRSPIVFDASSVEEVPSAEPYKISHEVSDPNLVVEVRVEADSYHYVDTVFSVPKGTSAGPLTVRLSRRLERVAAAPEPTPAAATPSPDAAGRAAMREGDRAFNRGAWLDAVEAYDKMPAPSDDMSDYGRAYLDAKLRQGVAHMNRSEFGRALEIFEAVTEMQSPPPDASLRLVQAQCAVGRTEEGRGTLAQLSRETNRMQPVEQSRVRAMIAYERGVCTHQEFQRAQTSRDRVRSGSQAIQELNAFVEGARAMSPVPPEVYNAVQDAERRVEEIRRSIAGGRGRGRGGA